MRVADCTMKKLDGWFRQLCGGGGDASFLTVFFLLFLFLLLFVVLRGFLSEFASRPGLPIDEARSTAFMT